MRLLLIILGASAAIVCIEKPAEARDYPWCAYYNFFHGGATNCGFSTYQQCLATVSGVGGSCGANPQYRGPVTRHLRRYPYYRLAPAPAAWPRRPRSG
jgi:hypothetical protein